MCVIFVSDKVRPTEEMVERAFETNPTGAGAAWRDTIDVKGKKVNVVRWQKGLTLDEIKVLAAELPIPFITHYRIPTCGGSIPELTHPFPIEKNVNLTLDGSIRGYVVFHNGHWGPWKDRSLDAAAKRGLQVPGGKWSDSRAIAWMAAHHGLGILDFIDEKCAILGPQGSDVEIFGNGWKRVNDVICSNTAWEYGTRRGVQSCYGGEEHSPTIGFPGRHVSTVCRYGVCKEKKFGSTDYCEEHWKKEVIRRDEDAQRIKKTREDAEEKRKRIAEARTGSGGGPFPAEVVFPRRVEGVAEPQPVEQEVREGTGSVREGDAKNGNEAVPDGGQTQAKVATSVEMMRWVRSLNPKRVSGFRAPSHSSVLAPVLESSPTFPDADLPEAERARRAEARAKGIIPIGPM